jgi:hypothetical protein
MSLPGYLPKMQFKYIESHLFHATAVALLIPEIYAYLNCNLCNIFHKQNLNLKISVLKKISSIKGFIHNKQMCSLHGRQF